jgi:hypothetical protein
VRVKGLDFVDHRRIDNGVGEMPANFPYGRLVPVFKQRMMPLRGFVLKV